MKRYVTWSLVLVFFSLALLHFYWAAGGMWGFESALPTTEDGSKVLAPSTLDGLVVGVGLLLFGVIYLITGKSSHRKRRRLIKIALWVVPLIFILRAIGDFRYVGFFKQVRATEFAQLDTLMFSPLCLVIGLAGLLVLRIEYISTTLDDHKKGRDHHNVESDVLRAESRRTG